MSRSYRTQKESIVAQKRIKRDRDGSIIFPRVVERRPRRGDVHPLTKHNLTGVFDLIPLQYLYGLRRIELRPRQSGHIGKPFGYYLAGEKCIVLYSLPVAWRLDSIPSRFRGILEAHGAIVENSADTVMVRWPDQARMSIWFWTDVLMHELGHHFMHQYRHKNRTVRMAQAREFLADLHARRFLKSLAAKIREGCAEPDR